MTEIERLERLRDSIMEELEGLAIKQAKLREAAAELEEIEQLRDRLHVALNNVNILLSRYMRRSRNNSVDVRPGPERPKPPAVEPSRDYEVQASIVVGGRTHSIHWRKVAGWDGVEIGQRCGGVAPILFRSHGSVIFGIMAPFADSGAQEYRDLMLVYRGMEDFISTSGESGVIEPGYGRFWMLSGGAAPDPDTATEEGRKNAGKHPLRDEDFDWSKGFALFWGKDANGPGGRGIYQENEWAVGCPQGLMDSLRILLGWANRNAIFRLERNEWDEGLIAPHAFDHPDRPPYRGNDQTKTYAPQGYEGEVTIDGYRQLDNAHGMRMLNPAYITGKYDYSFGVFCTTMLAFDVEATWVIENINDAKKQPHWWSVKGIMAHTPAGIGSPYAGRQLNYALQALCAAWELRVPFEFESAILLMWDFLEHIFDPSECLLYRISFYDEFGNESNKWKHKVEQEGWDHTIPAGGKPDVYKGFEQALVFCGLGRFVEVIRGLDPASGERAEKMYYAMHDRMCIQNRDLEVIGHREWSSSREAPFSEFILDTISNSDLDYAMKSNQAWHSDNPMNAYTGGLG